MCDFLCSVTNKNLMKSPPYWKVQSKSVFLGHGHSYLLQNQTIPFELRVQRIRPGTQNNKSEGWGREVMHSVHSSESPALLHKTEMNTGAQHFTGLSPEGGGYGKKEWLCKFRRPMKLVRNTRGQFARIRQLSVTLIPHTQHSSTSQIKPVLDLVVWAVLLRTLRDNKHWLK